MGLLDDIIDYLREIDDIYRHFQQYFSYIVAVSFIGGGNYQEKITDLLQVYMATNIVNVQFIFANIIVHTTHIL